MSFIAISASAEHLPAFDFISVPTAVRLTGNNLVQKTEHHRSDHRPPFVPAPILPAPGFFLHHSRCLRQLP
jgi:hypothetical protein